MLLPHDSLKCGNHNIECVLSQCLLLHFSLLIGAIEAKHADGRYPLTHLLDPLAKYNFRYYYDMV